MRALGLTAAAAGGLAAAGLVVMALVNAPPPVAVVPAAEWSALEQRLFAEARAQGESLVAVPIRHGNEVLGTLSFAIGARGSVAIAAVFASQYAALAAVAAFLLYREHLTRRQRSGLVAIALGVAVLTALRA